LSKYLVIVESPAKVKTISKFLSNDYEVEACGGHVRDLPKSKIGVDIEHGFEPEYKIIPNKKKIVSHIKKSSKGKDTLFLACDPDREGEAIAWHIAHVIKDGPIIKRVVFNELTKEVVLNGFSNSSDINIDKVNAQQARRILDRIVGYKISPLLWKKVGRGLSAGRVQSAALNILVDREREIQNFKKKEYWQLTANLFKKEHDDKVFSAKLEKIDGQDAKIGNEEEAKALTSKLEKADYVISKVTKKTQKRNPKPPFITSTLQQTAFNSLRYTASKTMSIAQKLYEGINLNEEGNTGLITYMRTDSVSISNTAQKQARDYISKTYGDNFLPEKFRAYKSKKSAQQAHESIRPTSVERTPESLKDLLSKEQYLLYKLIWERFVAACMKEARVSLTSAVIEADNCSFKATGLRVLFEGHMKVFKDSKQNEDSKILPELIKGEALNLKELTPSQHFTQPPARYTDASLIKTLEEEGIGRPSTYAPTIRTLLYRHYVQRQKRALAPTELGMVVNDLLMNNFPGVLDKKFTAKMEEKLDKIEQGKLSWKKLLDRFYGPFAKDLDEAKVKMRNVKKEVIKTDQVCEKCGRPMVIKWSRRGKFLSCSGFPKCKNAKSLDTGIDCPEENCDGKIVQRRSKRGRTFYGCSNYPKCTFVSNKLPAE
jgi:DNA topoisomerase-1